MTTLGVLVLVKLGCPVAQPCYVKGRYGPQAARSCCDGQAGAVHDVNTGLPLEAVVTAIVQAEPSLERIPDTSGNTVTDRLLRLLATVEKDGTRRPPTRPMLADKERNANLGVGIGLGVQIAAGFLGDADAPIRGVGCLIALGSFPVFVWGCVNHAEGKGHNKWVGLVGLVGLTGLVIRLILPNLRKNGRAQLADAMRLERAGHISRALADYDAVRERFAGTDVAHDPETSIRIVRTRMGLGDDSRAEPLSPRCREGTGPDGLAAPQVTDDVRGGAPRKAERFEYAQTVRTPVCGSQRRSRIADGVKH